MSRRPVRRLAVVAALTVAVSGCSGTQPSPVRPSAQARPSWTYGSRPPVPGVFSLCTAAESLLKERTPAASVKSLTAPARPPAWPSGCHFELDFCHPESPVNSAALSSLYVRLDDSWSRARTPEPESELMIPTVPPPEMVKAEVRGVPVWLLMFDVSGHESGNDPLPSVSSEFRLLVNDVAVVVSLHLPFESSDGKAAPRDGVAKCQGRWDTFWPALADKIITTLRG